MRGAPLIRAVVIVAILLLTAVPIWKLTHRPKASVNFTSAEPKPTAKSAVVVSLAFAHPASGFQLIHLGKVIWEGQSPVQTASKTFAMDFPSEGIDLELKAQWPAGTPLTAVRVTAARKDLHIERTTWGTGSLDEVLTFKDPD